MDGHAIVGEKPLVNQISIAKGAVLTSVVPPGVPEQVTTRCINASTAASLPGQGEASNVRATIKIKADGSPCSGPVSAAELNPIRQALAPRAGHSVPGTQHSRVFTFSRRSGQRLRCCFACDGACHPLSAGNTPGERAPTLEAYGTLLH